MLKSLHIENIAVIEKTDIEFDAGFNVLTGETGAGKSIIIDSINAVLGERTSRELIRTGASNAKVMALFAGLSVSAKAKLEGLGFACDDDNVLLQRKFDAGGKSSCRINGAPATAAILKEAARSLINIHGQHDSQALLDPTRHYLYIDAMAGHGDLTQKYTENYREYCRIKRELEHTRMDEAQKAQKLDMLNYQINEIQSSDIKLGEIEALNARKTLLQNSEKVSAALIEAYGAVSGTDDMPGAGAFVAMTVNRLQSVSVYDKDIAELERATVEVSYQLDDIISSLRQMTDEIEFDPGELNDIEERLDALHRLSRKYGSTEKEMLAFLDKAQGELNNLTLSEERFDRLSEELESAKDRLIECAVALTESRRKTALVFETQVCEELKFLDMPYVTLSADIMSSSLCSTGGDKIEFLISTNPGEPPKPLSKIASGGELSRIMLAIKSVIAGKDDVCTLIFDEIDTGISGRAAQKVGIKLKQTAQNRQIICVTHLAQIAAKGDSHLLIEKTVADGKSFTVVRPLDFEGRKRELARIVGGEITQTNLQSAAEMLLNNAELRIEN